MFRSSLGSVRLGRLFGITIRAHWLFLPLLLLAVMFVSPAGWQPIAVLGLLLLAVLLHELGHSLVAQSFGIRVLDITFWPLGGMARMSEIPENPRVEGLIAVAGPLVNVALFVCTLPFLWLAQRGALNMAGVTLVESFAWINASLALFNLLPAFPMDGGRILRAALGTKLSWVRATEVAVRFGRWIAFAMVLFAIFGDLQGAWILPLIALFVWFAGGQELMAVRLRHGLSPIGGAPLFGGPAGAAGPFGGAAGPFGGTAGPFGGTAGPFGGAAERDPGPDPGFAPPPAPRGGFSEAEVERLERYRGRLRRPD